MEGSAVVRRVEHLLILTHRYAGTDGIIKKIRETVGDKPVYLSIDVSELDQVDGFQIAYAKLLSRDSRRSIQLTQPSRQPQARLRLEVGPPASCAPS